MIATQLLFTVIVVVVYSRAVSGCLALPARSPLALFQVFDDSLTVIDAFVHCLDGGSFIWGGVGWGVLRCNVG